MIDFIPSWINWLFIASSVFTITMFYFSNGKPKLLTLAIILWSIIHSILAYNGFFQDTEAFPPRFGLVILPFLIMLMITFIPKIRKKIIQNRNTKWSTFLHLVRLPVEIVLLQLFIHGMVPELMTFEGRNFDIIAGITAPIVGLLYINNKIGRVGLLAWNVIGLILICFILFNGLLSAELPFQQFGFEQPNKAPENFPFILLPATIVPIVIWTHITDIFALLKKGS